MGSSPAVDGFSAAWGILFGYNRPMKTRSLLVAWLGLLLFVAGEAIGLTLSSVMAWSEIEANAFSPRPDSENMHLACPLMLAPGETGLVRAQIVNHIEKEIQPVVMLGLGQPLAAQQEAQTFHLAPLESQPVQWSVDSSHATFGRLILVNVLQGQYNLNPPRWGSCGILLFSLFGLGGNATFALIFAASLLLVLSGGGLWLTFRKPSNETSKKAVQACIFLAAVTLLALLTALPRLWGLTVFFDAFALIVTGVIIVEFILFPH